MLFIFFFALNSYPMRASLKISGIFVEKWSNVNFKVKYDFSKMKLGTSAISYFT